MEKPPMMGGATLSQPGTSNSGGVMASRNAVILRERARKGSSRKSAPTRPLRASAHDRGPPSSLPSTGDAFAAHQLRISAADSAASTVEMGALSRTPCDVMHKQCSRPLIVASKTCGRTRVR